MKSHGLTSKQLLDQLHSHKNDLFSSDAKQAKWKGFDNDHVRAIHAIPANIRKRAVLLAGATLCLTLLAVSVSLYVLIVGLPSPQPAPILQPIAEESQWYMESESWEDMADASQDEIDEIMYSIPQVEQNLYIIDLQLQWLAQPQW